MWMSALELQLDAGAHPGDGPHRVAQGVERRPREPQRNHALGRLLQVRRVDERDGGEIDVTQLRGRLGGQGGPGPRQQQNRRRPRPTHGDGE